MKTKVKRFLPIEESMAKSVVKVLDPILLDLLELQSHIKSAHWNLRDENFIAVHRLLDEVYKAASDASDEIAERIRQIGGVVNAPSQRFSGENRLPKFPSGELDSPTAIEAVSASLQKSIQGIREGISSTTDNVDEPITADMLTQHCGKLEKYLWFLDFNLSGSQ